MKTERVDLERAMKGSVDIDVRGEPEVQLKKSMPLVKIKKERNIVQLLTRYWVSYQKLSFREQLLLLGMMTLIVLFFYLLARWLPLQASLREETERLQRYREDLKSLSIPSVAGESGDALLRELKREALALEQLETEMGGIVDRWLDLDDKAALQSLKLAISSLALRTGLEVVVNKPVNTDKLTQTTTQLNPYLNASVRLIQEYARPGVHYEMRGSYVGFLSFLRGLNELPYHVSVGQFDISVEDLRTESGRHTLNIRLTVVL